MLYFVRGLDALSPDETARLRAAYRGTKKNPAQLHLIAYFLFCYAAHHQPRLAVDANGKPYAPDFPALHFNWSHTTDCCVCGISAAPIGVDVESAVRKVNFSVMNRLFTAREIAAVGNSASRAEAFLTIWTRKESYAKESGMGITDSLRSVEVLTDFEQKKHFTSHTVSPYIISAYSAENEVLEEIPLSKLISHFLGNSGETQ